MATLSTTLLSPGTYNLPLFPDELNSNCFQTDCENFVSELFVVNCENSKQAKYLFRSLGSYIFDIQDDKSNVIVTDTHPLVLEDYNKFDKVPSIVQTEFSHILHFLKSHYLSEKFYL